MGGPFLKVNKVIGIEIKSSKVLTERTVSFDVGPSIFSMHFSLRKFKLKNEKYLRNLNFHEGALEWSL